MSDVGLMIRRAKEIRDRLRRPPNAIPDVGIDLKRKPQKPIRIPPTKPPKPLDHNLTALVYLREIPLNYQPPTQEDLINLVGNILVREITGIVAGYFQIKIADIKSRSRLPKHTIPRHICFYLAKKYTRMSYPSMARACGRADHTTSMYGVRNIIKKMQTDPELCSNIMHIEARMVHTIGNKRRVDCDDSCGPSISTQPELNLANPGTENVPQPEIYGLD